MHEYGGLYEYVCIVTDDMRRVLYWWYIDQYTHEFSDDDKTSLTCDGDAFLLSLHFRWRGQEVIRRFRVSADQFEELPQRKEEGFGVGRLPAMLDREKRQSSLQGAADIGE